MYGGKANSSFFQVTGFGCLICIIYFKRVLFSPRSTYRTSSGGSAFGSATFTSVVSQESGTFIRYALEQGQSEPAPTSALPPSKMDGRMDGQTDGWMMPCDQETVFSRVPVSWITRLVSSVAFLYYSPS